MINFTHKMMERKVINCNNNSFSFNNSRVRHTKPNLSRNDFSFSFFSLSIINQQMKTCVFSSAEKKKCFSLLRFFYSFLSERFDNEEEFVAKSKNFYEKNQARENIFRIFFVRLESETFGKWSRGSTVVSVAKKTTMQRRIFAAIKFFQPLAIGCTVEMNRWRRVVKLCAVFQRDFLWNNKNVHRLIF